MDDLLPVLVQDDWTTPAIENGAEFIHDENMGTWKIANVSGDLKRSTFYNQDTAARAYCDYKTLEAYPYQNEALEHWIITDWLADELEAKGEMVIRDFLGLTIWGRSCSGAGDILGCCDRHYLHRTNRRKASVLINSTSKGATHYDNEIHSGK